MIGVSRLGIVPEMCSLFTAIAILLFTNYKIERNKLGKLVRAYGTIIIIAMIFDIVRYIDVGNTNITIVAAMLFLSSFVVTCVVMTNYSLYVFNTDRDYNNVIRGVSYTLYTVILLIIWSSPWTELAYYVKDNEIHAGKFCYISFFAGVVMIGSCIFGAINGKVTKRTKATVFHMIVLVVVPCAMEAALKVVVVSGTGLAIGLVLLILTFHDGKYNLEYGAESIKILNNYISKSLKKSILAVTIDGTTNKNKIFDTIRDIMNVCGAKNLFMQDNRFFIIIDNNKDIAYKLCNISKRRRVVIKATAIAEKYVKGRLDILMLLDVDEAYRVVNEEELLVIEEKQRIKNNIIDIIDKKDSNDSRVMLYAQPILNVQNNKFETAEALCRLKLDDFQTILTPNRFMDIVRELKGEHEFNMIMLNKACQFIKKADAQKIGFDSISVNFNPNEVCKDSFVSEVVSTIIRNGISNDRIHIEITEASETDNIKVLEQRIKDLKRVGFEVYLDDFGTGYSNVIELIKLGVDVIKFDKSVIDDAITNEKSKDIVVSLSNVLNQQGYKVLFEGIETLDGCSLAEESSASFIQGYYYSKPLAVNDSIEFIKKKNMDVEVV